MATETPYGSYESGEGGPNITPQTMDAYPQDVQEPEATVEVEAEAKPAVGHIVGVTAAQHVVGAAINPAVRLANLQNRVTLINTAIGTQQTKLDNAHQNAIDASTALDLLNGMLKNATAEINTLNIVLGNAAVPDPSLPS